MTDVQRVYNVLFPGAIPPELESGFTSAWQVLAGDYTPSELREYERVLASGCNLEALDIDAARGCEFGAALGLAPERSYPDYPSMFAAEALRPDGIQAVSIATPNGTHYTITKAALQAGLHVVCEKPLCFTIAEAEELRALSRERKKVVGVTYGYAGHQLIEQGRAMIERGDSAISASSTCSSPTGFTPPRWRRPIRRRGGGSTRGPPARATCSATWGRTPSTSPR